MRDIFSPQKVKEQSGQVPLATLFDSLALSKARNNIYFMLQIQWQIMLVQD